MSEELKTHWFCAKCNVRREVLTIGQNEEKVCEICGATIPPHKGNCVWMNDNTLGWYQARYKIMREESKKFRERMYEAERRLLFGDAQWTKDELKRISEDKP